MATLRDLFSIDGHEFKTASGTWLAKVVRWPLEPANGGDAVTYFLEFIDEASRTGSSRKLKLNLSNVGLLHDVAYGYRDAVYESIRQWLETDGYKSELNVFN